MHHLKVDEWIICLVKVMYDGLSQVFPMHRMSLDEEKTSLRRSSLKGLLGCFGQPLV